MRASGVRNLFIDLTGLDIPNLTASMLKVSWDGATWVAVDAYDPVTGVARVLSGPNTPLGQAPAPTAGGDAWPQDVWVDVNAPPEHFPLHARAALYMEA